MNNEELDSQLSAMFDDELPAPECELLARRLARDETLKARWGRYAAIGAAMRVEKGVRTHDGLARRVGAAVAAEPSLLAAAASRSPGLARPVVRRWWQPAAGAAMAASVAVGCILWMRAQSPDQESVAQSAAAAQSLTPSVRAFAPTGPAFAPAAAVMRASAVNRFATPDSYVVPIIEPTSGDTRTFIPPAELADYVVAHSEFSAPLLRHSALSSLVTAEPATNNAPASPVSDDRTQNADEVR